MATAYLTRNDSRARATQDLALAWKASNAELVLLLGWTAVESLRMRSAFPCENFSLSACDRFAFFRNSTPSILSENGSSMENITLEDEYFDDIQDVKVTKDMLDLAKHIVNQKTATFDPAKFEDHYESALTELINQKRSGEPITAKARPKGENVVDLMEALKCSIGTKRKDERQEATRGRSRPERNAIAHQR